MRGLRSAVWTTSVLFAVAGCSRAAHPAHSPQPPVPQASNASATPAPSPAARAVTPAAATPTPTAVPSPGATPGPSSAPAAPRIVKKVPRLPADAAPQILAVAMSATNVAPGDRVSGSVVTSSNVASVEARIGGYAVPLSKVGVGRFALTYTVGPLPWFVRGNFTLQVIARNTRGDAATRAIPLTVR